MNLKLDNYTGKTLELKEEPNLYFGNPDLTIGRKYVIISTQGSNLVIKDNTGEVFSIGSCRFHLQ